MITSKKAIYRCSNLKQGFSTKNSARQQQGGSESDTLLLITPQQYASRSALMSSLIVAWSPALKAYGVNFDFTKTCSILAVGGKSGNISFWRIYEPQCYTIEHGNVPVDPVLIGLLQAHSSWITAISWAIHGAGYSKSQLVLATGSCDGSVKIWLGDVEELTKSSEADNAPFSLLREVTAITAVPVSTISLAMSVSSIDKVVLAIGRGSGSVEVWICHIASNKLQTAGVFNAHNQVVTGLTWDFDSCCLYSCSQDNSVRSWVLHENVLHETPFPLNLPGHKDLINLSQVSDLCFGLALSPGGLVVAVVRSFDSELLNQMYQARTQKAAVEFYWNGRRSFVPLDKHLESGRETSSSLSERDLECWESTILGYLKHYENGDEPLVLWDFLMAMHALNNSAPSFVKSILFKWMSSWFTDYQSGNSLETILIHLQNMLPKMSIRRMHLLNIICRKLILGETKSIVGHRDLQNQTGLNGEKGKPDLWTNILVNSERELQQRFISFTFRAVLSRACTSCSTTDPATERSWCPVGVAQMERWVDINPTLVHDQLKFLRSKIGELGDRINSMCAYTREESCSYCSAPVPFESVGAAKCEGIKYPNGSRENHELKRCAFSMQLLSITSPMWCCVSCQRQAANLPPLSFFVMPQSPLDVSYESESFPALREHLKPLCLFCGILLQRSLPNFLLSAAPV